MSVITFTDALAAQVLSLRWAQIRSDFAFNSAFGSQGVEVSSPLWGVQLSSHPLHEVSSGDWKALLMNLDGQVNQLALWDVGRPAPVGTLRGSMTLNGAHAQGDVSLVLKSSYGNLFTYSEQFDNAAWTKGNSSVAANVSPAPFVSHESNLFLYSEQFDTAGWTKTRSSITPDAVMAPNGELTADALIEDGTAANSHFLKWNYTPVKGKRYTQSVYAKAKTGSRGLYMASGSAGFGVAQLAHFNIDTGAVISSAGGVTTSIESVGDGWYRCAMTTVAATAAVAVSATNFLTNLATTTYNGDGVSGLYLWGAQLEDDATLSLYRKTTTAAITVTSEADALIENTAVGVTHNIYRVITTVFGARYAFSVYVKPMSGDRRVLIQANSGGFAAITQSAVFNLSTGVVSGLQGGATGSMESIGDGWYRCALLTVPAIAVAATVFVMYLDNGTTATYTGNGTSGVYLWGAKLEVGDLTDYGVNETLLPGDLLGLGTGATQQVVMVTAAATSTSEGSITCSIKPPLRNAHSDDAAVTWDKPKALFRRVQSGSSWDYDETIVSGFALDLVEDVRA